MKVSIDKTTGLLIEMQSNGTDEALTANALTLGFTDIEIKEVTEDEFKALLTIVNANQPKTFAPLSAWQVRKVLTQFNLRANVEAAVAQADQNTKDAWQYAKEFERDNAVLNGMAQMLGMTDAQVDTMFDVGATL